MTKFDAWIFYDKKNDQWVLNLWDEEYEWVFSKAWHCKDEDEATGDAWVSDNVLSEIAHLQDIGYKVKVTVS